jgi:hypothetical protein
MSARTSGSRLTGIRPDLSAVVRMTKEEGPWKHSPGFSLGWDFNPMVRPHKVLLWSAHGEKHPPCRVLELLKARKNYPTRTVLPILHYFPRSPISPAELRMLDLTRRPDRIL